ncbi:MAG: phycobilisome rod-core linker polypeptide [Nitrospira sp.]|nr:phycobilisome rod-core linker polypeptide [Nitrospira sp.]
MRPLCAPIMTVVLGISALCLSDAAAAEARTPQEAAAILAQSYAQLLMRSVGTEPGPSQTNDVEHQRYIVQSGYAAQLAQGEKTVKQVVEAIALSSEFNAKWITPHMGTAQVGSAPGVPPVAYPEKAIDNLYCALLGRRVDSASLASARKDLVSSGFERVIRDVIDGKEYRARFGDTKVPQLSSEKQVTVGCPQVAL